MIGLVERAVDSRGTDVSLDPLVLERMAECVNAVTDIWYPASHIGRTAELLTELKVLRDAAVVHRDSARATRAEGAVAAYVSSEREVFERTPKAERPCSFGPYKVEKIGEIHRLVDEAGNDVMRHSFGIQRVVDALNAFRKVFDPVEYRAAIEADCRKLEDQRRAAWAEYESLIGFRDLAA